MQIKFPLNPAPDWPAQFIGKKWRWCGRGPEYYDCFGLLIFAYRQFGYEVKDWVPAPTSSVLERALQTEKIVKASLGSGEEGILVTDRENNGWVKIAYPIPGTAILFKHGRDPHHVGMFTGNGDFIHACESLGQVVREPLSDHQAAIVGFYVPKSVIVK